VFGLIIVVVFIALGGDPRAIMQLLQNNPPAGQQGPQQVDPAEDELAEFVKVVLADTEDVWTDLFRGMGQPYQKPVLVLFRGQVQGACGFQSSATGPFYCPGDSNVYLDLSFFNEMARSLNAPGDFAQAYVVAHEVGHHVQNLLGISDQVHAARGGQSKEQANRMSVRLELQADFLAGVWAHHAQRRWQILEEGDVEEALRAATAIGDDRLQQQSRGVIVPESFTHGTSEQRVRWFVRGFKTGDVSLGKETFELDYDDL
jgi:predicted metalloprotease